MLHLINSTCKEAEMTTVVISDETEVWRDIKGFEGQYQVSSHGRVRSLDFIQTFKGAWGKEINYPRKGRIKKQKFIYNGYLVVCLAHNKHHLVSRLVAFAFLGEPPPGHEVNHKDGVKTNNHYKNLEWVTKSQNQRHRYDVLKKMPESQLAGIRKHHEQCRNEKLKRRNS